MSSDSLRSLRLQFPRTPSFPPQTGQGMVSCPVITQIPSLKYFVKSDTLTMTGESRGSSSPDCKCARLTMENRGAASFFLSVNCYTEGPAPQTPRDLSRGRFPSGLSSSTPALYITSPSLCTEWSYLISSVMTKTPGSLTQQLGYCASILGGGNSCYLFCSACFFLIIAMER